MRITRAIIHLEHFRHNLRVIRSLAPDARICLAVKADAYGHGAARLAAVAADCGVDAFGVATVEEGIELRDAGIAVPIILYGLAPPDEIAAALSAGIELFCTDEALLDDIALAARLTGKTALVHLKIDTGMGRIGCRPSEAVGLARAAARHQAAGLVSIRGTCTHFPRSEDPDRRYTAGQIERFAAVVEGIRAAGIDPGLVHAANSGGIGLFPAAGLDMVRPGIMAYGYPPGDEGFEALDLRPVMELRSGLSFVKRVEAGTPLSYGHRWTAPGARWIGTVPVGYADGLPRLASGRLSLLVEGPEGLAPRPQVGTICMDQCLVDLGPAEAGSAPPNARWSEAVVFGPQPGAATAASLARELGTIPYEILCGISRRVPRVYLD